MKCEFCKKAIDAGKMRCSDCNEAWWAGRDFGINEKKSENTIYSYQAIKANRDG